MKVSYLVLFTALIAAPVASAEVPYQFIARQYSEVLGRGPDQSGFASYADAFRSTGCSQYWLKQHGRTFYLSSEFQSRGYTNAEKVFVAYRGILGREPDPGGFDVYLRELNNGMPYDQVVDILFDSSELAGLVPDICAGGAYRANWERPIVLTTSRSQVTLQAQLNAGGVVTLNPQEVVYLTSTLSVPATATLRTDAVDRYHTARFGRLVRDANFSGPLVEVLGSLDMVWIDGQRGRFNPNTAGANISALQGSVLRSRIGEPTGWTNLHAPEWCTGAVTAQDNLITGYSTSHTGSGWADGLSIACSGSRVRFNHVIDPTDVGIVVFSRLSGGVYRGTNIVVEGNHILAAGRSAYGGAGFDSIGQSNASFSGSYIQDNTLWTSPLQHFEAGLYLGTESWAPGTGRYASALRNTTGNQSMSVRLGLVVDGMFDATVQSNTLSTVGVYTSAPCPLGTGVNADVSGGHASGSIQQYTDRAAHGCMYHP
jgi:hypothetical protein